MPVSNTDFSTFTRHLHTRFLVKLPRGDTVEMVLARVDMGSTSGSFEQFCLVFEGPVTPPLPQGTYGFEHGALGALDIFIVPIRQDHRARTYEAVFSRSLTAGPTATPDPKEAIHEPT